MTINQGRHYPNNLMRCAARPAERYGDVELSVQASGFHASDPRDGCGHSPLELYDRVEVALCWANTKGRVPRWIRRPSREVGIDGFDDLWLSPEDVPIAEYVLQDRVAALRAALASERDRTRPRALRRALAAGRPCDLGRRRRRPGERHHGPDRPPQRRQPAWLRPPRQPVPAELGRLPGPVTLPHWGTDDQVAKHYDPVVRRLSPRRGRVCQAGGLDPSVAHPASCQKVPWNPKMLFSSQSHHQV